MVFRKQNCVYMFPEFCFNSNLTSKSETSRLTCRLPWQHIPQTDSVKYKGGLRRTKNNLQIMPLIPNQNNLSQDYSVCIVLNFVAFKPLSCISFHFYCLLHPFVLAAPLFARPSTAPWYNFCLFFGLSVSYFPTWNILYLLYYTIII